MINNKKATSKIVSVLSAFVAVIILSTTVFASGVLSDLTADDYTIKITSNGKKIELANRPFFNEGELYIPLRETIKQLGFNESNSYIGWNNGIITIALAQSNGVCGLYRMKIGSGHIESKHIDNIQSIDIDKDADIATDASFQNVPILKNSVTYIPLNNINYIVYGFLEMGISNDLTYKVYDKNNNDVTDDTVLAKEAKKMRDPIGTAELFFKSFNKSDFEKMKTYCTQNCIDTFFGDGSVFGMKQAALVSMKIDKTEYAKSSNDFNIIVSVNMVPNETSVFDPSQRSTSFYLCLLRQSDGRYLINEFATGL